MTDAAMVVGVTMAAVLLVATWILWSDRRYRDAIVQRLRRLIRRARGEGWEQLCASCRTAYPIQSDDCPECGRGRPYAIRGPGDGTWRRI